jgi:DNA-binding MarR family transcriptional regulator
MTTPITTTLRALTADTEALLSARLRPLGITVAQLEFLAVFAAAPDCNGSEAARACHVTPQTGTSVMRGLVRRGLIETKHIPGGGRRLTIAVTPDGHRRLNKGRDAVKDVEKHLDALFGTWGVELLEVASDAVSAEVANRPAPKCKPKAKAVVRTKVGKKKPGKTPRKTRPAAPAPADLHTRAQAWSTDHHSPGRIPAASVTRLGTRAQIRQLLADGTWTADGDHYLTGPA